VLAWTAAKMMLAEPLVDQALAQQTLFRAAIYLALVVGVLGIAALRNRRSAKEALP
jgi:hypothetical protein